MLWRVLAYSRPGLPSPAIKIILYSSFPYNYLELLQLYSHQVLSPEITHMSGGDTYPSIAQEILPEKN